MAPTSWDRPVVTVALPRRVGVGQHVGRCAPLAIRQPPITCRCPLRPGASPARIRLQHGRPRRRGCFRPDDHFHMKTTCYSPPLKMNNGEEAAKGPLTLKSPTSSFVRCWIRRRHGRLSAVHRYSPRRESNERHEHLPSWQSVRLGPSHPFCLEDASRPRNALRPCPNLIISSSHLARATAGAIAQATGARTSSRCGRVPRVDLPADDPDLRSILRSYERSTSPASCRDWRSTSLRRGRSSMPPWRWPTSLTAVSPTRRTFTTYGGAWRGDPPISRGPAGAADCSGRPRRQTPTPSRTP